jgi:hypothetical protein
VTTLTLVLLYLVLRVFSPKKAERLRENLKGRFARFKEVAKVVFSGRPENPPSRDFPSYCRDHCPYRRKKGEES